MFTIAVSNDYWEFIFDTNYLSNSVKRESKLYEIFDLSRLDL